MSYEDAIAYMEKYQCLPLCKHGNHLIDWGRELLAPPCGCSLTMRPADLGARAHVGDPCIYCHTPHDEVSVGDCPSR